MRFGVLGPVEVWDGGRQLAVGGPQQRALLAALLLNANRVVSTDRLVDYLWGEQPPPAARGLLQGCVAGLRRVLKAAYPSARDRLRTVAPGYLLRVEPGELDLGRFEELAGMAGTEADPRRAAGCLSEALSLWRGPALDGIDLPGYRPEVARLEEQRLTVLEQRIDLDLRRGRYADLVGELQPLVATYPLRERLWEQLMLAFYQADRRADALDAYRQLRQTLVERLGVEPGEGAQRLQRAVLTGGNALTGYPELESPSRDEPPSTGSARLAFPAQLPAAPAGFAGRGSELASLNDLLADTEREPPIGVISGMAGIGKTALALYWAHQVVDQFPDGQLYVNLRGFDPSGPAIEPAEAVRGFLDALGVPTQRIPAGLDGQASLYRTQLASRRVLVVLDNARDAEQVRPLLPGGAGCCTLVTSRDQLTGLVVNGARSLPLQALGLTDSQTVLARRLGKDRLDAEPSAVEAIIARCAGLPLALAIVAARATTYPDFPLAVLADEIGRARTALDRFAGDDTATDLRAVFSWSYRALDSELARLFRLLSLHPGPDFSTPAAASLAGCSVDRVRTQLAGLARVNLLVEHRPGRFASHDLLRAYAIEQTVDTDTDAGRRATAQRVLDHYLHTARAADQLLFPFREPVSVGLPRPGVTPEDLADSTAATDWFTTELPVLIAAVGHAAAHDLGARAYQLAFVIAAFLDQRVRWLEWAATQHTALATARRLGDRAAEALAHRMLGRASAFLGRHDDADAHLRRALELYEALDDVDGQARTHHRIAMALELQERHTDAVTHATRALELYRTAGNEFGQATALNNIGWNLSLLGDHRHALGYCTEALSVFARCDHRSGQADVLDSLGHIHHHLGEHGEAENCYQRALALYQQIGSPYYQAETADRLGDTYESAGRPDQAQVAWRQALSIFDELDHPRADEVRTKLR